MGEAAPMMPMPAETLRQSTAQISQNCSVLWASLRWTLPARDHGLGAGGRRPARRAPAGRRQAIAEGAPQHEHEIDEAHGHEGLPDADRGRGGEVIHQDGGERAADHGAPAEAHDRHAGRHAAAIREPFDQGRDRRDVAEPEAATADDAGAEPHQPKLMDIDADRGDHEAAAPAERRDDAGLARTDALEPAAPDARRRCRAGRRTG